MHSCLVGLKAGLRMYKCKRGWLYPLGIKFCFTLSEFKRQRKWYSECSIFFSFRAIILCFNSFLCIHIYRTQINICLEKIPGFCYFWFPSSFFSLYLFFFLSLTLFGYASILINLNFSAWCYTRWNFSEDNSRGFSSQRVNRARPPPFFTRARPIIWRRH